MRISGKLTAAIEILTDFEARRVPLKTAIADWGRANRYAGAKDRAWISGLCLDVLRRKHSLAAVMGDDSPRSLVLGAMRVLWAVPLDALEEHAAEEPHGPGALSDDERSKLAQTTFEADAVECASPPCMAGEFEGQDTPAYIAGDYPRMADAAY